MHQSISEPRYHTVTMGSQISCPSWFLHTASFSRGSPTWHLWQQPQNLCSRSATDYITVNLQKAVASVIPVCTKVLWNALVSCGEDGRKELNQNQRREILSPVTLSFCRFLWTLQHQSSLDENDRQVLLNTVYFYLYINIYSSTCFTVTLATFFLSLVNLVKFLPKRISMEGQHR